MAIANAAGKESTAEFDPLNHAYAVYLGGGLYVSGEQSMFIVRFAPKITLRNETEHPFGIRLRLTAAIGLYDISLDQISGIGDIPDYIGTFALVPGVEFPIQIYKSWVLMPFIDAGVASDTAFEDATVVTGIGARSRAEWRDGRHDYVLWNELVAAANHYTQSSESQPFTLFRADFEMRGIVDYRIYGRDSDLGLLFRSDTFINSPVLGPGDDAAEIRQRWEVGFTTGPTAEAKVLWNKVTVPRVGISYRFGQNRAGFRVVLRWTN